MQTNNTLILVNENFANMEEKRVKDIIIMTKDQKYLISAKSVKFNKIQIKLDLNSIILTKKVI